MWFRPCGRVYSTAVATLGIQVPPPSLDGNMRQIRHKEKYSRGSRMRSYSKALSFRHFTSLEINKYLDMNRRVFRTGGSRLAVRNRAIFELDIINTRFLLLRILATLGKRVPSMKRASAQLTDEYGYIFLEFLVVAAGRDKVKWMRTDGMVEMVSHELHQLSGAPIADGK